MGLRMSESAKPYFAMVCLQFGYAGMNLVTKTVLDRGMSHYVLVTYRNAFATAAIAPFAFLSERKVRSKMTFTIFMHIFVLALLGPVIDQNLYYIGLKLTSPTFSTAVSNIMPAITFILATLFRMEKVEMKKVRCQVKVVGILVTVVGSVLMIFYKGPFISFFRSQLTTASSPLAGDYLKATIFLLIASLSWAAFFILQASTLKKYSAHLSLSTIVCFMGTMQSLALTFIMEHNPSALSIGFDMNLLASAYAGIMSSSIAYYIQGLMMQRKGPVFVTAFNPLIVVIVLIMSFFVLGQGIYRGGVIGVIVLTVGVYVVLWGKHVDDDGEARCSQDNTILEAVKCCSGNNGVSIMPKINETNEDVETGKLKPEENESPVVVVVFGCENVDNISWCKYMAFFFVRGKVGRSVTSF
ncbi:WAT1-related protein [Raphanus sativus]|uniref:WAT1-related protein n=1 Tax=Raphanus sativus TaxID=3726 RepID=A0A6J0N2W6_RAPSA|nr:WAT1-related protein At2g40900 [Raphanus sativus]KAJ4904012.1 WAT1-related protein [Raphanus sativus]